MKHMYEAIAVGAIVLLVASFLMWIGRAFGWAPLPAIAMPFVALFLIVALFSAIALLLECIRHNEYGVDHQEQSGGQ